MIAVGGGLKGCELKDVIAAGDLINRAIFNGDELRSGLTNKLRSDLNSRQRSGLGADLQCSC